MTASASQEPIEIALIADLACPWCLLGLVRLDRGARDASGHPGAAALVAVLPQSRTCRPTA